MPNLTQSYFWKILEASALGWVFLFVCILILGWAVFRVRSWFREGEDPDAHKHQMLMQFRDLHREGSLSDEEYRSIKRRLVDNGNDSPRNDTGDSNRSD